MPSRIPGYRPPGPTASRKRWRPAAANAERTKESNRFLASARWRRLRRVFLDANPLCDDCLDAGRLTPATEVHHRIARRERPDLALDAANLQGLCRPCHASRTARGE